MNNLSYLVERKCILRNISGKFYKGKVNVLMGPSGAGKVPENSSFFFQNIFCIFLSLFDSF